MSNDMKSKCPFPDTLLFGNGHFASIKKQGLYSCLLQTDYDYTATPVRITSR